MGTVQVRMPIEVDITYANYKWCSNIKRTDRHFVIGFLQRNGDAIIKTMPDGDTETIIDVMLSNIEKGAIVYCEDGILPPELNDVYEITRVLMPEGKRVVGDIHINNVRGLWRDLKRTIKRTHISVSQKHLQLYCDEVAWRYNTRNLSPMDKFNQLLVAACNVKVGKKRTFKDFVK